MSESPLSAIAPHKRRRLAATLGLFAVLFLAIGAVAATDARTGVVTAFAVIAVLVAVVLALLSWGVARSIALDRTGRAHRSLDQALEAAAAAHAAGTCGCGHDHAPPVAEPDPCAHDGHGTQCSHNCDTCVLQSLRPQPDKRRPSPTPR